MDATADLTRLSPEQLRVLAAGLQAQVKGHEAVIAEQTQQLVTRERQLDQRDETIQRYRVREEKLTHEIALLRRHRFGKRSEVLNKQQLWTTWSRRTWPHWKASWTSSPVRRNPGRQSSNPPDRRYPHICLAPRSVTTLSRPRAPVAVSSNAWARM